MLVNVRKGLVETLNLIYSNISNEIMNKVTIDLAWLSNNKNSRTIYLHESILKAIQNLQNMEKGIYIYVINLKQYYKN